MKKTAYILSMLSLFLGSLSLSAQESEQYAIYNYRNDGDFNAWLNIDVDSITFSCFDLNGVEHEDIVVQEVWTPDSVYRIPLDVIDSLSFRAPEIKYKDNVFHITAAHLPYVQDTDEWSVTFISSLPIGMRPDIGQVIISDVFDEPFENGFLGTVTDIRTEGQSIKVICGEAQASDVFDELVLVGRIIAVGDDEMNSSTKNHIRGPRRIERGGIAEVEIPGKFELKLLDFIKIKDEVALSCDYYLYFKGINLKVRASIHADHDMKAEYFIDTDLIAEWISGHKNENEPEWLVPIPLFNILGIFDLKLCFGAFIDPKVKLELKGTQPITLNQTLGFEVKFPPDGLADALMGPISPIIESKAVLGDPEVSLTMKGSLFAGVAAKLEAMFIGEKVLSGNITGRFGPEVEIDLNGKFSTATQPEDVNAYSILKDSKVSGGLKADAKAKFKVFKNVWPNDEDAEKVPLSWKWDWEIPGWQKLYFVPEFTKPQLPHYAMPNPLSFYTTPSRDLVPKTSGWHVGIAVFDEDENQVLDNYCTDGYRYEIDHKEDPRIDVSGLTPGQTYRVVPMLSGMKCAPSLTFTVPQPVSLEESAITLTPGSKEKIHIAGGWGAYQIINKDANVANALFEKSETPDDNTVNHDGSVWNWDGAYGGGGDGSSWDEGPYFYVTANDKGSTIITLKDLRSNETSMLTVTVQDEIIPDLTLSETALIIEMTNVGEVLITSGSGTYSIDKIEPEGVVTISISENRIFIEALKAGTATITVKDNKTGQTASFTVTITDPTPTDIPAEPIDLGLPSGTLWASYNVGATKPEEYGKYYSWGEIEVRDQYYFTTYSLCDGTVSSCHDIGENISGTKYDVAHVKWGGEWCMPTKDDFMELVYNCEYKETTQNGVKGFQFTGPNGNYIFLPYTGYYWNTENEKAGREGSYWSATQTTSVNKAHEMSFKNGEMLWDCYINRFAGLTVRPVIHSTPTNEASITFQSAEILEVSSEPKYNGDGEYLFTWYTTKFKYVIKIDGADMIDYIQPIIYDNGTWAYNGGKSRVPGNGMYSVTTSMSYDNDANMNWATGYLIALKDGTTIYSTNILQFGGTPESPTVIVSASTPKLSKPKKMKKSSESAGSKPTFGNMGLEKLR